MPNQDALQGIPPTRGGQISVSEPKTFRGTWSNPEGRFGLDESFIAEPTTTNYYHLHWWNGAGTVQIQLGVGSFDMVAGTSYFRPNSQLPVGAIGLLYIVYQMTWDCPGPLKVKG